MRVMNMLLVLVLLVIFADYSEAGIIKKTYDEASDETSIYYEVVDGDNLWNIYKEIIPEKITMYRVNQKIKKPNKISKAKKLAIGKVLVIKVKGKNLNVNNMQNQKSEAVTENPKREEIAVNVVMGHTAIKEDVPFVSVNNSENPKKVSSDVAESDVPVRMEVSKNSTDNDLSASLKAAEEEIVRLREAIAIKDQQILLIRNERDKHIAAKNYEKEVGKKTEIRSGQKNNNQESVYHKKVYYTTSYYNQGWLTLSIIIILVLFVATGKSLLESIRDKDDYNPNRENKGLTSTA